MTKERTCGREGEALGARLVRRHRRTPSQRISGCPGEWVRLPGLCGGIACLVHCAHRKVPLSQRDCSNTVLLTSSLFDAVFYLGHASLTRAFHLLCTSCARADELWRNSDEQSDE